MSERRSGSTKFVNSDRLGSTTQLTDSTEATTDTREYDAFGQTVSSTGSTATPFGFVGKGGYQQDLDSGLMLLGHRYYDASTGRFITRDPVKDGRNWCVYCKNSPLALVDALGLGTLTVGLGAEGILIALGAWGSVGVSIDLNNGHVGLTSGYGGGAGAGVGITGGLQVGYSSAPLTTGGSDSLSSNALLGLGDGGSVQVDYFSGSHLLTALSGKGRSDGRDWGLSGGVKIGPTAGAGVIVLGPTHYDSVDFGKPTDWWKRIRRWFQNLLHGGD